MGAIKQAMAEFGLFGLLVLLAGCAEVIVPGAFTGASEAYNYTTSNVVKKTLMGDAGQVKAATRSALKKMDVHFESMKTEENETEIEASTPELEITISITPVTAATTKVKVNAVEDHVFLKQRMCADNQLSRSIGQCAQGSLAALALVSPTQPRDLHTNGLQPADKVA